MSSTRTKRTYAEAFGQHTYETEKYNQEIAEDYFMKGGTGHGVYSYDKDSYNKEFIKKNESFILNYYKNEIKLK